MPCFARRSRHVEEIRLWGRQAARGSTVAPGGERECVAERVVRGERRCIGLLKEGWGCGWGGAGFMRVVWGALGFS